MIKRFNNIPNLKWKQQLVSDGQRWVQSSIGFISQLRRTVHIYIHIYCTYIFSHQRITHNIFHICHQWTSEGFNGSQMLWNGSEYEINWVRACVRVFFSETRTRTCPRRGALTLMMSSAVSGGAHADTKVLSFCRSQALEKKRAGGVVTNHSKRKK